MIRCCGAADLATVMASCRRMRQALAERVGRSLHEERATWLAVGSLFAAGLIVRVAWLETQPYIMAGDDAAFAIQSVHLKDKLDWVTNPFKYGVWHHPLLYHTMVAVAIEALGNGTRRAS